MGKGRLTLIEQKRRLNLLLEFVFLFRYATREQMLKFSEKIIKLSNPRWLVDYASKKLYLNSYRNPSLKPRIYYLSGKGKALLYEQEAIAKWYRFDKRQFSQKTFNHQNAVIKAFLLLIKHLDIIDIGNYQSEWLIRHGKDKRKKLPDAILYTRRGARIAVIAIIGYKDTSFWENLFIGYSHDIEELSKYHAALIITRNKNYHEGAIASLHKVYDELRDKFFIFTYPAILEKGQCFYNNTVIDLREAASLLKGQGV